MLVYIKYFFRGCFFLIFQLVILNQIPPIHLYITPYIYFLFILWLPINTNGLLLLSICFIYGIFIDFLTNNIGLHTAACLLVCLFRYKFLNILFKNELKDLNFKEPSLKLMGTDIYLIYIIIGVIIHNGTIIILEWIEFDNFLFFAKKLLFTCLISLFLVICFELLFSRLSNQKK